MLVSLFVRVAAIGQEETIADEPNCDTDETGNTGKG
jgi:hypothetical protein